MATSRAFKNLASLRDSFHEPVPDEQEDSLRVSPSPSATNRNETHHADRTSMVPISRAASGTTFSEVGVGSSRPKIDGRRQRKVLKTPTVGLSVSVRAEIHEEVSAMLFARKSTWIALLDELLTNFVNNAKDANEFPK